MNFKKLLDNFTTEQYLDALKIYGRIFVYHQDEFVFFFRPLTVAEIETVEKVIYSENKYMILELEDWILSNTIIYLEPSIEDIDDLPSHIVTSLAYSIVAHSYSSDIEQIINDIENSKQRLSSPLDVPYSMAVKVKSNIEKDNINYVDLIKLAGINDMDKEVGIKERYETAKQEALKQQAAESSKGR